MGYGGARKSVALAALAIWLAGAAWSGCSEDVVELRGPWGQARLSVEIADTAAERAQGLMFREKLPTSAGMLFLYDHPQRVGFWMKNTLIPLDMIFIDVAGKVTRVHSQAKPHDLASIDGGEDVLAVLEINGGLAARLGISEGTELRHPFFAPIGAAWPCGSD